MIFTFAKYFRNIKKKFRTTYKKMIFMLNFASKCKFTAH